MQSEKSIIPAGDGTLFKPIQHPTPLNANEPLRPYHPPLNYTNDHTFFKNFNPINMSSYQAIIQVSRVVAAKVCVIGPN
jgi:hypothetical protein